MPRRYTGQEIIRVLRHLGWVVIRQRGSHVILIKPGVPGHITVPDHGSKEIIQRTFSKIVRQAGLTRREFGDTAEEVL
jgi:predicted RNA binding protein YcfA (HicA-like mRNA interferase family)